MANSFKSFLAMAEKSWKKVETIDANTLEDVSNIESIIAIKGKFGMSLKIDYPDSVGFIQVSALCEYPLSEGDEIDINQIQILILQKDKDTIFRAHINPLKKKSFLSTYLDTTNK